ncbi:hypothetical protein J4456_04395 [Candidatus Pacearchaeota archaeon]|nr:hypothetical protein [Candidatus Pacearchaeota archaeon]
MQDLKIRLIENKDLIELADIYNETYRVFDVGEKWTKKSSYDLLKY